MHKKRQAEVALTNLSVSAYILRSASRRGPGVGYRRIATPPLLARYRV